MQLVVSMLAFAAQAPINLADPPHSSFALPPPSASSASLESR